VRVAINGIILVFALTVIGVSGDDNTRNWALGAVGVVTG
jgi:hypothetical protein